ncbi:MAG: hypothetical protein ACLR6B_21400 [Blautia sp.]
MLPEELPEFERQVNEAIEKNLEIEVFYPTREELEHIDYRSKKRSKVRYGSSGSGIMIPAPAAEPMWNVPERSV